MFSLGMAAVRDERDAAVALPGFSCRSALIAAGGTLDCRYLPIGDAGTLRALLCVLDDVTELSSNVYRGRGRTA